VPEHDDVLNAAIDDVLSFVDPILPQELALTEETLGDIFGCAAIRRLADLLRAESTLARTGHAASSRVIGRAAIEAWLWATYLLLAPEVAIERLILESQGHERRRLIGMNRLWERVHALATSSLPRPDPPPSPTGKAAPDIRSLAEAVADARRERGFDGGRADGAYHDRYRWDSVYDVHPSFDLLMRYFAIDEVAMQARFYSKAQTAEGNDDLRGTGGALETALLLLDALGVYSQTRGVTVPRHMHERMMQIASLEKKRPS
jgi:hypothetical protein